MNEPTAPGSSAAPSDLELMQWVDGELEGEREAEVRAFVERNPRARRIVDSLVLAGNVVRDDLLGRISGSDDIADAVMARVEREPRDARPAAVVPLAGRSRLRWAAAGGAASVILAAAAAWMVWVNRWNIELLPRGDAQGALWVEGAPSGPSDDLQVHVESVDLGGRAGTLFYVRSEKGTTPVLWIDEARAKDRP